MVTSDQYGNLNDSRLKQSNGSTASILQRGNSNTLKGVPGMCLTDEFAMSDNSSLLLTQRGDCNVLELYQENSSAWVRQTGHENESLVLQH